MILLTFSWHNSSTMPFLSIPALLGLGFPMLLNLTLEQHPITYH